MADDREQKIFTVAELTKLLKRLKTDSGMALSYAFGIGATPEKHVLVIHRVLEGKKIWEKVKAAKRVKKGMYGKVSVDGTMILLTPERSLSAKKRDVKAYLALNKPAQLGQVKLLKPDGSELSDEDEDEPAEDSAVRKQRLGRRLEKIVGMIDRVIKANPERKSIILPLVKQARGALDTDRLDDADDLLKRTALAMTETGAGASGSAAPKAEDQKPEAAPAVVDEAAPEHFRAASSSWQRAQEELRAEILKVQKAIRVKLPGASTYDAKLEGFLFDYFADLFNQLDRGVKEEGNNRTKIARGLIKQYRKDAKQNPILKHLEKNPFAEVKLEKIISGALSDIESRLAA